MGLIREKGAWQREGSLLEGIGFVRKNGAYQRQ